MKVSQGYYVSSIYRHLQIYLNSKFTALGFGSGQYLFFNQIAFHEGITQKELSSLIAIDKATTAKAVHKLTELGYIEQRQNPEDRRYNNLFLTPAGKRIVPDVRKSLNDIRSILQRGMTDEESSESLRLLGLMLDNIIAEVKHLRRNNDR